MAIKDTSKKPYIVDNDTNVKVGIDLPIRRDDIMGGWFASTTTTIDAVRNNIKNLLSTNQGERLFQPNLGLNLRTALFENISDDSLIGIQDSILDSFAFWLPFVEVRDIQLLTSDDDVTIKTNEIRLNILFNIVQDPNTLSSISIDFDGNVNDSVDSTGAGGY